MWIKWTKMCAWIYGVCPEGIQSCNMKNRDIYWRKYKIQKTLYTGQWHLSPLQSRHLESSHSSPRGHQLPFTFSWISSTIWNLFLFKGDLVLGKARSCSVPNLGCRGHFAKKVYIRPNAWVGASWWWSCQSLVAHSCGFLNHPNV